jgi:hypothetical protein
MAVCAAVLLLAGSGLVWLRALVGIPFTLLFPGQAAMLTVDPDGRLDVAEWFALSVGLSISITMLLAVALASTIGLGTVAIIAALVVTTLLALVVARMRTGSSTQRRIPNRRNPGWRAAYGTLLLLACTLLILVISVPDATVTQAGPTVQLWGLPDKSGDGLRIGANNVNAESQLYRLTVEQGGRVISQQDFDMRAGTAHIFVVKKSAMWTTTAPIVGVLSDLTGIVPPRRISVWTPE